MYVTLPKRLVDAIDASIANVGGNQKIMRNNSYYFFYRNINASIRLKGLPGCYVNYDRESVRGMLGRNYVPLLEAFHDQKMIAVDNTAIKGHKTYGYRVNSTFLDDSYTTISVPKGYSESVHTSSEQILRECEIDMFAAHSEIMRYANSHELFENVLIGHDIPQEILGRVRLYSNIRMRFKDLKYIRKDVLMNKFATAGFSLIKQDKRYYYMPLDMFKIMRRQRVLFSYNDSLARFIHGDIYSSRDDKGNRLHSNITNMPSRLAKWITYESEYLIELDLKNSQWCFLVYCLENPHLENIISQSVSGYEFNFSSPKYQNFRKATGDGELYEWIQQELHLRSRDQAKEMLFETLFGTLRQTENKRKLRALIPEIVDFLDYLKGEHSYKVIPCTLQQVEANVMIDTILKGLHADGIPALSKHDAILIPTGYYPLGKRIVAKYLDITLVKYKLKEKDFTP